MSIAVTKRKILVTTSTSTGDSSSSESFSEAKRARPDEVAPNPEEKGKVSLWQCGRFRKYQAHPVFLPYSPEHKYRNSDAVHHYRVANYQYQEMAKTSQSSSPFPSREVRNVKDSIQSVTYIENKQNELTFEEQRKLFAKQGKLNKSGQVEERLMFHGTTEDSLWRLLEENFDLDCVPLQVVGDQRLRSKKTVYGRGVYFSALPRVSLMYGDILVLCKVMVGTSQTVAPVVQGSPVLGPIPSQYDSRVVRGGGQTDLVMVVRSPAQVLPYCVIKLLPACLTDLQAQRSLAPPLNWAWTKVEMDWQCGLRGRDRRQVAQETVRRHTQPLQRFQVLQERGVYNQVLPVQGMCSICLEDLWSTPGLESVTLKRCRHSFHSGCLVRLVEGQAGQDHLQCPNCQTIHGVRTGNMPTTTGRIRYARHEGCSVRGYPGEGVIVIEYQFQDGVQDDSQPRPGKPFYARGFPRTAFLPGSSQGQRVLHMLITAFKRGLTFTIGSSVTTGQEDCLVWNGIHHKTGGHGYGYPDPGYLARVIQELKLIGVEG